MKKSNCFARLFRDAARSLQPNDTLESLNAEFAAAHSAHNLVQESLVAKKISIINALEGLYLYIPCKLQMITETQKSAPSEIYQDLVQALSLIYFVEQMFAAVNSDWLAQQKTTCQSILGPLPTSTKDFLDSEAQQVAGSLLTSYQA